MTESDDEPDFQTALELRESVDGDSCEPVDALEEPEQEEELHGRVRGYRGP